MQETTISRSYAGALLELGDRSGEAEAYARAFAELDRALSQDARIRRFLETPKIDPSAKQRVLRTALEGKVPDRFLRFLLVVLSKHRQGLLHSIREQYEMLLDEQAGRVHAQITLAREPDDALVRQIARRLSELTGQDVVPHVRVDPAIVGGVVVRWGDRVLDGSVRRQLLSLKREMMRAGLPEELPAGVGA